MNRLFRGCQRALPDHLPLPRLGGLLPLPRLGGFLPLPRLAGLVALLLACLVAFQVGPAIAQGAAPVPAATTGEPQTPRARLEAIRGEVTLVEAALQREGLTDAMLQELRARIEPSIVTVRTILSEIDPRVDAAKARLDQLGPKPDEKAGPEAADLARDRAEREKALQDFEETQRIGRAVLLQAEQLLAEIADRRRAALARSLFQHNGSLLSPELWTAVANSFPRDIRALQMLVTDWIAGIATRVDAYRLALILGALGIAFGLSVLRLRLKEAFAHRDPGIHDPGRREIATKAATRLILGSVPIAIGCLIIQIALDRSDLLPFRLEPVSERILRAIVFVAFARAFGEALLSPDLPQWRFVNLPDAAARRVMRFIWRGSLVIGIGRVLESLLQAIAANLTTSVLVRGAFALFVAVLLVRMLRRLTVSAQETEAAGLGPYVPAESRYAAPLRLVGWVVAIAIAINALVGYVALAAFLIDQLIWLSVLLALLVLGLALVDEWINWAIAGETRLSIALRASVGVRKRSLEQAGVLISGAVRLALVILVILLALAPLGVESNDLVSQMRAAFFGFQIGDVTVSLSAILLAVLFFGAAYVATRSIQHWLECSFLPTTELDAGLRNSIKTAFGYLGFIIALMLGFSQLGVSLDKLTIVAGALSVGIGFGLQSIVSNFVSGLILLWERPIRVGDLIVVGDGEGHVRRINVRSTEIETFDRSTVIVPNSSLVTGVVRNRVRNDRTGRVIIAVSVPRASDPAKVRQLLLESAGSHGDVMKEPPPRVFFKKIGDANLDFELVCVVQEIETAARVQSDLHFVVFKKLIDEGIIALPAPAGPAMTHVTGFEPIAESLEQIAEAIGEDRPATRRDRRPPARSPGEEP
jgi:small-conductance mechanosensitive channel